jgi:anionic cell wall polymer biosynthesis LytR-Cps2A-Psr (LCP) family protein
MSSPDTAHYQKIRTAILDASRHFKNGRSSAAGDAALEAIIQRYGRKDVERTVRTMEVMDRVARSVYAARAMRAIR